MSAVQPADLTALAEAGGIVPERLAVLLAWLDADPAIRPRRPAPLLTALTNRPPSAESVCKPPSNRP